MGCRELEEFILDVSTKNLYNLKEIPCFSLYFPCLAGNKNSNSRLFVACLKVFFLALSSLCRRFEHIKTAIFNRFSTALEKQKSGTFYRVIAALVKKYSA